MIFPKELNQAAVRNKVRDTQIEKDYALSWILYGISKSGLLREELIFKGGTVLKKAWFPDYRFSEDLDFTLLHDVVRDEDLLQALGSVFAFARRESNLVFQLGHF
jgi:uncharacterized protein